jgi:hypothetical protein
VKRLVRTSQFKGVCWNKSSGKWYATRKGKSLGYHASEEAAAGAYTHPLSSQLEPFLTQNKA